METKITNFKVSGTDKEGFLKLTADIELGSKCNKENAVKLLNDYFFRGQEPDSGSWIFKKQPTNNG